MDTKPRGHSADTMMATATEQEAEMPRECHGNAMEMPREYHGNAMEWHGNAMEMPWKCHGSATSLDKSQYYGIPRKYHGNVTGHETHRARNPQGTMLAWRNQGAVMIILRSTTKSIDRVPNP